jgi:hypothetical protein
LTARRNWSQTWATCDWNYTLDVPDTIALLLPDAQEMRMQAQLLALKARVELAEGHIPEAIHTLHTGFAFSQHVAQGPFLISDLVGIAAAGAMADVLLDEVQRPEAPNLYWSLTALPRPLIDLRDGLEFEQRLLEQQFPDVADLERGRSPEQWDALLKHIRRSLVRWAGELVRDKRPDRPVATEEELAAAKKYLGDKGGFSAAALKAMPPGQVMVLALVAEFRELRDDLFKGFHLPYPQAVPLLAEASKRLKTAPASDGVELARALLPGLAKVLLPRARLERKLAALRVVEALRLSAAANGGELPDKLEQVKVVPVPDDPVTGKPFTYERDGRTATLSSRGAEEPADKGGLRLRITVRK